MLIPLITVSPASAQEEDLPNDVPFVARVVHGVKYPQSNRWTVDVGMAKYYGERLAKTWGYGIEPTYHVSEKLWFALPIYFYQSTMTDGASSLSAGGSTLVALDPQMTLGPVVGYNPVYGKFVLGEHIEHFRAGVNAGLIGLQLRDLLGTSASNAAGSWTFGLQGGVQMQVQLDANWEINLFSTALVYQMRDPAAADVGSYRIGWLYGLSGGRSF
jgi:hypothetical protein